MPDFDFDAIIDRREVPALKVHKLVLGADGVDLLAAGVADMDFRAPPASLKALNARAAHGIFAVKRCPTG
ncbi:MAG: cystathionine beta-lyase [Paracoccaceae bacterium]|jgi:cystathionine beta-lyase